MARNLQKVSLWRSRWAAFGAVCAVVLGGGTLGVVNAGISTGERAVFVPVSPVRILDTRLNGPVSNNTLRLQVEGVISTVAEGRRQVVPQDASAASINLTATNSSKNGDYGYVTAFPCAANTDIVPTASSLNFENRVDIANGLTVSLSSNGGICLYVYGTADIIVDVAGYFIDHDHDDRYYTETEINTALANKPNITDVYTKPQTDAEIISSVNAAQDNIASRFLPIPPQEPTVTVDNTGISGINSTVVLSSVGLPIILYYSASAMKLAMCQSIYCETHSSIVLDNIGGAFEASMSISSNGWPIIAYFDSDLTALKVISCTSSDCSTRNNAVVVDNDNNSGRVPSINIGRDGNPIISFASSTGGAGNFKLKFVSCTSPTCSTFSTAVTLDPNNRGISTTELSTLIDGRPVALYFDSSAGQGRLAICSNPQCSGTTRLETVGPSGSSQGGFDLGIAGNGRPVILGSNGSQFFSIACSDYECTTFESPNVIENFPAATVAITVLDHGYPLLAYLDSSNPSIVLRRCFDFGCSSLGPIDRIEGTENFNGPDGLVVLANGFPMITAYDSVETSLKAVVPWWLVGEK